MWWCISGPEFSQDVPSLQAPDPFSNYKDDRIPVRVVISLNSPQLWEMHVQIPIKILHVLDWIYLHSIEAWLRHHLKEPELPHCYSISSTTLAAGRLATALRGCLPSHHCHCPALGIYVEGVWCVGRKAGPWKSNPSTWDSTEALQFVVWIARRIIKCLVIEGDGLEPCVTTEAVLSPPLVNSFRMALARRRIQSILQLTWDSQHSFLFLFWTLFPKIFPWNTK